MSAKTNTTQAPDFKSAEYGRMIGAQLKQKIMASLSPEIRDALTTAFDLAEIYDQTAPSDLYRVPKAKPSADNLQANIERAEVLLSTL